MAKPEDAGRDKVEQGKPGGKTFNKPKTLLNSATGETRDITTHQEMKDLQAQGWEVQDHDDVEAPDDGGEVEGGEVPPAPSA